MRARLACAAVLAAAAAGCAAPPAPVPPDPAAEAAAQRAHEVIERLVNADNGLEVRTWIVPDDAQRIGAALMSRRRGEAVGATAQAGLARNGLRLVRLGADDLDALLAELGTAPLAVAAWHGQVPEWRRMHGATIGDDTLVLAGGTARRLEPGRLELMARSWTVLTEDGPLVNLELVAETTGRSQLSLRRLVGPQAPAGEPIAGIAVELQLEPGFAYALTGEAPNVLWQADGVVVEPPPAMGPGADVPPTIGEVLFAGDPDPLMRCILVFVPRIPPRMLELTRADAR